MNALQRSISGAALGGLMLLGAAGAAFAATSADPNSNATPGEEHGEHGGHGARHHGGKHGMPLEGLANRMSEADFAASGVSKPAYWDTAIAWVKSEDAKKVGAWLIAQGPPAKPADGVKPAPGAMLDRIDFTKAGVTKPVFWDALVAFVKSADGQKVFQATQAKRHGEHFAKLSTEFGAVDFTKAGVTKPAFWDQMVTWLKSADAVKLGAYMMSTHMQAGAPAPDAQ